MPPDSTETGAPLIHDPGETWISPRGSRLSRMSRHFRLPKTTPIPFPRSFSRQVTMVNSSSPSNKNALPVGRSPSRVPRLSSSQSVTSSTASSTGWSLTKTLIVKPYSSSCIPESLERELLFYFILFLVPRAFCNVPFPFHTRPPLFEIGAEVWALDKFHGSFTTLRSELLARNMQRRMSPIARLCGDLALLGDPVVLWNWKRKGPFFTMSSGNIHHSPTVSHDPICTFESLLIAITIIAIISA